MKGREINLSEYKSGKSSIFTGRSQGEQVRKEMKLSLCDSNPNEKIIFIIPNDTTSFNPSFYLGLLYESLASLKEDTFKLKYSFKIDSTDLEQIKSIQKNLDDGYRSALNTLHRNFGFKSFTNE
jgi:hypothetical protein